MAGIDHENLPLADNYSGVATGFVLDFIHAIGQFGYFSSRLAAHWRGCCC
jgi:ABC-type molybdate transport system permease subunit